MAMTSAGLKARIITKLNAAGFDTTNPNSKADTLAGAIAEAVVEEIQAHGATTVTTTCPAGAGTGTGTVS
jgi:hypothetical protein